MGTMEIIETRTLSSNATSVTFSGISGSFNDLMLLVSARSDRSAAQDAIKMTFNGNTANYTQNGWYGLGPSTRGGLGSSPSSSMQEIMVIPAANSTANYFSNGEVYIAGYSTNLTKLVRSESVKSDNSNTAENYVYRVSGAWNDSAAITSVTLAPLTGTNFVSGSTFTVYGIKGSVGSTPKATGGVLTEDNTYYYHTFAATGTFTALQSLSVDYLVIAGGGGGGRSYGGGGGAGGLRTSLGGSQLSLGAAAYTVTVGAGGAGSNSVGGSNGTNSSLSSISATGGGGGAYGDAGSTAATGKNGGSGGGGSKSGSTSYSGGTGNAGGYTPVEGYAGASGATDGATYGAAGGGGGAGGGGIAPNYSGYTIGGTGGVGALNSITGTAIYYAGGGGGGTTGSGRTIGTGGSGGGGNGGSTSPSVNATSGQPGTGGGGGGDGQTTISGNGGSGLVIIRYAK